MDARNEQSAYARAGVDIDAGHRAVELMKDAVARTHTPAVLGGIGGFGGLFSLSGLKGMEDPVLVASTDGVGTKTKVAVRTGRFGGLGQDIVNHCVNDILVQGARPLIFLDYVAMGRLSPERVAEVVTGAATACEALGVALLGGETAEMPGVYVEGELDIVGTIVGAVDRPNLIDGRRIEAGDSVIALPSSGLHTNGYSLARMALDDLNWTEARADLNGERLEDLLTVPHRAYLKAFDALEAAGVDVRGMGHITGGGLVDNPPRVFPQGIGMQVDLSSWTVPPVFELIVQRAGVERREAFRALNMGVGFLFIVPAAQREEALAALRGAGEQPWVIGEMVKGQGVTLGE
ncbi:phosphoribosylformylglycinamidine cyclo-ligase [Deinococcus proteolyticus MRP]|uniref:Phosphoribosylformylglycinamidine cyclo-ligase n=1 Tax=Deinococcus proteolyticus (strain ATCC 35074 / DSM 20540 / JCM 6276 / NBRC 101906 / NCIMB 13154 / VKM Ac-1939 / CCM 2703 / MRP) TaxID=693977 RepID=F0RNH2_DEIPM|nr:MULTISPECIES: phosphoribosylformylglycinamidine cyclo-ligase [Deinococcus]ADY26298.1 phosphoribosylformylglycinamidine cyclo-ligase [Deinococcus proteolyticus MRP]MCY1702416.1 phosphoribosylformylglycinamidine cyclo-ligase [Deinococcus sp. SL84]